MCSENLSVDTHLLKACSLSKARGDAVENMRVLKDVASELEEFIIWKETKNKFNLASEH